MISDNPLLLRSRQKPRLHVYQILQRQERDRRPRQSHEVSNNRNPCPLLRISDGVQVHCPRLSRPTEHRRGAEAGIRIERDFERVLLRS